MEEGRGSWDGREGVQDPMSLNHIQEREDHPEANNEITTPREETKVQICKSKKTGKDVTVEMAHEIDGTMVFR